MIKPFFQWALTLSLLASSPALAQDLSAYRQTRQAKTQQPRSGQSSAQAYLNLLRQYPQDLLRPYWVYALAQQSTSGSQMARVLDKRDPLWPHFWWWRGMSQSKTECTAAFKNYAQKFSLSRVMPIIPESTELQGRLNCLENLPEAARLQVAQNLDQHRYFWLIPRLLKSATTPQSLWLQGNNRMTRREYKGALNSFETLIKQRSADGNLKKQAVLKAAQAAAALRSYQTAKQWRNWISKSDRQYYPEVLWQEAELAYRANQRSQGHALVDQLVSKYPEHARTPEAIGFRLKEAVETQSWQSLRKLAPLLIQRWPDHEDAPMARYWLARSYQKQGQNAQAQAVYQMQSRGAINNYYTQLSICRIKGMDCFRPVKTRLQAREPELPFLNQLPLIRSLVKDKQADILQVIAPFAPISETEQDLLKSYAYRHNGHYFRSIRTIWTRQTRDIELLRLMYPLHYNAIQKENAQRYNLPQALIAGLTWQESMYKADIRSASGAMGLMQLMPATAKWIAPKAGLPGLSLSQLSDPKVNVRLGSYYLSSNLSRWNQNLMPTIASYNAGPNAVAKWVNRFGNIDKDTFVERIPYEETRRYVKQVLTHSRVYETIYAP